MNSVTKRIGVSLTLVAAIAAGTLAYTSGAAGRLAGRPTVVVTVRLKAVMESLDQWAQSQASMASLAQKFKTEDEKYKKQIEPLETKLKELENAPDSAEKRQTQEQFAMAMLDYQAFRSVTVKQIDIEKSLLLQNLYRNVKTEVKNMALAEGYDIVLVDDSQGELGIDKDSRLSREAQILQQVAARRMLYTNPELDITNDLITRMNNTFHAGGTAAATPATNGGKP